MSDQGRNLFFFLCRQGRKLVQLRPMQRWLFAKTWFPNFETFLKGQTKEWKAKRKKGGGGGGGGETIQREGQHYYLCNEGRRMCRYTTKVGGAGGGGGFVMQISFSMHLEHTIFITPCPAQLTPQWLYFLARLTNCWQGFALMGYYSLYYLCWQGLWSWSWSWIIVWWWAFYMVPWGPHPSTNKI